jgi:glycosyltransferase involved in cell wall biosynthesis
MKIALVGPGILPIPPPGWGAVEILIWDYYNELKNRGIEVDIINKSNVYDIINDLNGGNYDFIHIHYDRFYTIAKFLRCNNIAITSHYPYIDKLLKHTPDNYDNIFLFLLQQRKYYNFVLADKDMVTFIECGADKRFLKKIKNGINSGVFEFKEKPIYDKTVYLGKITPRKNQSKYQMIETIDFIGNCDDENFDNKRINYLGEWTREQINKELTNYANLLLISQGEADPLVVKEALIAGLGVVINRSSAENLDKTKDFITIIEDDKVNDIEYVKCKIEENKKISIEKRREIRNYGIDCFDIKVEVDNYLKTIKEIIAR